MIIYGDRVRRAKTAECLSSLLDRIALLRRYRFRSHARRILIDLGQLHQGVVDHFASLRGYDELSELDRVLTRLCAEAARLTLMPFNALLVSRFKRLALDGRARILQDSPKQLLLRSPEGFAFYSIYPELYMEAAARWSGTFEGRSTQVIGLRSIGSTLAAAVAVGMNSDVLPLTVRPHGETYDRHLRIGPLMASALLSNKHGQFAIVDEGPGLSGSSFGCVADWLEDHSVAPSSIHFFTSHGDGLSGLANPRHLMRWRSVAKNCFQFSDWVDRSSRPANAENISDGRWRSVLVRDERLYPPSSVKNEKTKFLIRNKWLVKFSGLDSVIDQKVERAKILSKAGFAPEYLGMSHGFIIQRWHAQAQLLSSGAVIPRRQFIGRVAEYLAFRSRLPAQTEQRCSVRRLLEMAKYNLSQFIESDCRAEWGWMDGRVEEMEKSESRVATDNRLHEWEWIWTPDKGLLKADAIDHSLDHEVIGEQDITWDLAGAAQELRLNLAEVRLLLTCFFKHGGRVTWSADKLRFYTICYLAFQLGYYSLAADNAAPVSPDDENRCRLRARMYTDRMLTLLGSCRPAFGARAAKRHYSVVRPPITQ